MHNFFSFLFLWLSNILFWALDNSFSLFPLEEEVSVGLMGMCRNCGFGSVWTCKGVQLRPFWVQLWGSRWAGTAHSLLSPMPGLGLPGEELVCMHLHLLNWMEHGYKMDLQGQPSVKINSDTKSQSVPPRIPGRFEEQHANVMMNTVSPRTPQAGGDKCSGGFKFDYFWDFPGGLVTKTLGSQYRGLGSSPHTITESFSAKTKDPLWHN